MIPITSAGTCGYCVAVSCLSHFALLMADAWLLPSRKVYEREEGVIRCLDDRTRYFFWL